MQGLIPKRTNCTEDIYNVRNRIKRGTALHAEQTLLSGKNQKRSKVNEISFSKRIKIVFYTVAHSVPFRAGKHNDGLCADNRPVQKQRLGAYYGAAFSVLIRTLCAYEYFRGSLKRQVGQKSNYACVRQLCRGLHHCYAGTA